MIHSTRKFDGENTKCSNSKYFFVKYLYLLRKLAELTVNNRTGT